MRLRTAPVLAGLLTAIPVYAQDAVQLKIMYAAGQRRIVHSRAHIDIDLKIKNLQDTESLLNIKTTRSEEFLEEILEADADGNFRSRVRCTASSIDSIEGTKPQQSTKGPLLDRTLTVSRRGAEYAVNAEEGAISEGEAARIGRWHDIEALLPSKPVKLKDSWDAPAGFITLLFKDVPIKNPGDVKVTFIELTQGAGGSQVAVLSLAAHIQTENKPGQPGKEMSIKTLSADLTGSLSIDLAAARPVGCSLSGSLAVSGEVADERETKVGTIKGESEKLSFDLSFEPVAPGQ